MPRRVNLVTLLGLIIIIVLSFGISAGAQPADEDIQENNAGLPEAEFNESLSHLERLQNEAEAADGAYRNALDAERRLNDEIARTRDYLTETEGSLKEAESKVQDRAKDIYMHGGNPPWLEALGQAEDPRKLMDMFGLLVRQLRNDREEVQELREAKETLEQTEQELGTDIEEREGILEEAANNRDNAQRAVNDAQEFFNALEQEEREAIEEERARRAQEIVEMFNAPSLQEEGVGDEQDRRVLEVMPIQVTPVQEQQPPEEPADELTEEENHDRQAKVAWAVSETMRELAGQAEPPAGELDQAVREEEPQPQNPVAEIAADTAKKQADADRQAREAADQVAAERQVKEKAAEQAEAAKKAELAAQQAPAEERQRAQTAAEEARRLAELAAKEADAVKTTATETAGQATMQREAAEKSAAQLATERATTMQPTTTMQPNVGGLRAAPGALGTPPSTPGLNPAPSGSGDGVIGTAKSYLGQPYVPGGLDCSGFTRAVYGKLGVALPDSPGAQWGAGKPVQGAPAAGDLVFWDESGKADGVAPTHVGIAVGDGTVIHSSVFTGNVTVTPMDNIPGYMGAKRVS